MSEKSSEQQNTAEPKVETLEQLLRLTEEIKAIRKKQKSVSIIGVLVILVLFGLFAFNLYDFGRNFDQGAFVNTTCSLTGELLRDPEITAVRQDVKNVFYPELKTQFAKKFQDRMPQLKESIQKEADAMSSFVEKDLQQKFQKSVTGAFDGMEKRMVQKYSKNAADTQELDAAFNELNAKLAVNVKNTLENKFGRATESLVSLNKTVEGFKENPEYKNYQSYTTREVENRLIESLLEIWIYNLNPNRGNTNYITANGDI